MLPNLTFIDALSVPTTQLGEGLHYSSHERALYWVDIQSPTLFRYCLQTQILRSHPFSEPISWVNQSNDKRLIIGCQSGVYFYHFQNQTRQLIWSNSMSEHGMRLNDAKTDRHGHLFFGTMDILESKALGSLFRLDGIKDCELVDQGYIVSNGPAFSVNGEYLYSVSSTERKVYRFNLSPKGHLSNKQVLITWPEDKGFPDGITVDSLDNIWIASWGGYGVLCFNPQGLLLTIIDIPAPYVTNIIFTGSHYKDVYITTAIKPMSAAEKQRYPFAGKVLHYQAEVAGLSEYPAALF